MKKGNNTLLSYKEKENYNNKNKERKLKSRNKRWKKKKELELVNKWKIGKKVNLWEAIVVWINLNRIGNYCINNYKAGILNK